MFTFSPISKLFSYSQNISPYKKRILFSALLLVFVAVVGATVLQQLLHSQIEHHIILTQDGFVPEIITIKEGETITFSTQNNEPFWPASNIHPEHTLYPEFDPKKPVNYDESWSFTFTQAGRYSFHDHIFANYTGLIVVEGRGKAQEAYVSTLDINQCATFDDYQRKRQCWDEQLEQAMREGGVEGAFAYFNALYKTEPDVPKECHGWSHTLGKAGYAYYKEHGDITLDPAASACGYGFYHAFLGELMKDTGDFTKAREFCENASITVPDVATSCKHGIGHGASSMLSESPEYEGDFQATANGAISICEKIYTNHDDLIECYDGVYNEIYQNVLNSRYGYDFNDYLARNDPFWQCHMQQEMYIESCYVNVVGLFGAIYESDFFGALKYALENTRDLENRGTKIIGKIAADRIQTTIVDPTHDDSIEACNIVPDFLFDACFGGILNGFIQHGDPNNLHPKGYAFCNEVTAVDDAQGRRCYENFTQRLLDKYSKEQMISACEYVGEYATVPQCLVYTEELTRSS